MPLILKNYGEKEYLCVYSNCDLKKKKKFRFFCTGGQNPARNEKKKYYLQKALTLWKPDHR